MSRQSRFIPGETLAAPYTDYIQGRVLTSNGFNVHVIKEGTGAGEDTTGMLVGRTSHFTEIIEHAAQIGINNWLDTHQPPISGGKREDVQDYYDRINATRSARDAILSLRGRNPNIAHENTKGLDVVFDPEATRMVLNGMHSLVKRGREQGEQDTSAEREGVAAQEFLDTYKQLERLAPISGHYLEEA